MGEKRTFTVESSNIQKSGGRYTSKTPNAAAKKAASQLFKKAAKSKTQITFELRETTKGEDKKIHKYTAKRVKLAKPKVITIMGNEITYRYTVQVKAV
jgi:hypothetical protein|tara:strand:- start:3424 stop:3717 length:294 start_codon:yes stop_codon:yes gene_type:complete